MYFNTTRYVFLELNILLTSVGHHVPPKSRASFFRVLHTGLPRCKGMPLLGAIEK